MYKFWKLSNLFLRKSDIPSFVTGVGGICVYIYEALLSGQHTFIAYIRQLVKLWHVEAEQKAPEYMHI